MWKAVRTFCIVLVNVNIWASEERKNKWNQNFWCHLHFKIHNITYSENSVLFRPSLGLLFLQWKKMASQILYMNKKVVPGNWTFRGVFMTVSDCLEFQGCANFIWLQISILSVFGVQMNCQTNFLQFKNAQIHSRTRWTLIFKAIIVMETKIFHNFMSNYLYHLWVWAFSSSIS